MPKYNLTTLTENQPSTNLNTGNSNLYNDNPFSQSPLDEIFNEDDEKFEDDLFNERHLMSQSEFDNRLEEDQYL